MAAADRDRAQRERGPEVPPPEREITAFISSLATDRNCSASTQNQALSALVFLIATFCDSRSNGSTAS